MTSIRNYLSGWHFMRLFRFILSILIIVQGVATHNGGYILAGSLLALLPLFNAGCCAAGTCRPSSARTRPAEEITTFEEIKPE